MESMPAWLAAMACGREKSEVPSVRMLSLRRITAACAPAVVVGTLMQKRSLNESVESKASHGSGCRLVEGSLAHLEMPSAL
jgi:hypothetical protein